MWREKGRDLIQSYEKSPYTLRKIQKVTWQHKNATIKIDFTTIPGRLRTVSWSINSHTTGVVKPVNDHSTNRNSHVIKRHTFKRNVNNVPYRDWGLTTNQTGEVIKMWYTNIYINMDHIRNSGTISSDPKPNKVVQELKVMSQLK